jgi:hypothetical protein
MFGNRRRKGPIQERCWSVAPERSAVPGQTSENLQLRGFISSRKMTLSLVAALQEFVATLG